MNHSELAHKWAHAAPEQSRRCGSMSFTGDTLRSYNTPIAKVYRKKNGAALVLASDHSYSISTAKHLNHASRATSNLPYLRVPRYIIGSHGEGRYRYSVNAASDHKENLEHFARLAADALAKAKRAQIPNKVTRLHVAANEALDNWHTYADFFGIRRKAPAFPGVEWKAAHDRVQRIANPDPASLDKRERQRAKRVERNRERDEYLAEQRRSMAEGCVWQAIAMRPAAKLKRDFYRIGAARTSWRLGDAWGQDYEVLRSSACMLRVDGNDIETSWGARVPVTAAPMVWGLAQRAIRNDGIVWRASERFDIGDYPLDRIDADGTLHAGCHTIPYSELAAMARQLGLAS